MHKHLTFSICLFSILLGTFFLTYRGVPLSGDELAMFSTTESLVRYGESRLYSVYYQYPGMGDPPFSKPVHEPMQMLLSMPLYWTAFQIDAMGMLHTVWLFNIFVTAGIGVVLYLTGSTLGYHPATSFATALLVCLGTMLWPYTQTYFREPLAAFWVILAFYLAFTLQKRWRGWVACLLLVVCVAALLTKEIMFLMLPALLMVLWPEQMTRRKFLVWSAFVGLGLIFAVGIVAVISKTNFGNERFNSEAYAARAEESSLDYFLTVVGAYLLSPGRSIWATSPVLILTLYGSRLAYRQCQWRLALAPFILLLTVTAGYAVGGWDWHGGLGWGTRYLLHVVPVMGLLLLPVLQKLPHLNRFRWFIGTGLLTFSIAIQISGLLLPTSFAFETLMTEFPEKGALAFQAGTWQPRYAQWYLHLKHLNWDNPTVAWQESSTGIMSGILFIVLGAGFFWGNLRRNFSLQWTSLLIPVWLLGIGISLSSIQADPRFKANRPELQALLAATEQQAGKNDLVLLANPEYVYFFLNSYRGKAVLVTLPYLEGERYSPSASDPIVQDADTDGVITPNERLDSTTSRIVRYVNQRYENVWLVMNSGPFLPWAYRPVEELLTSGYFPVSEMKWSEDARLIRIYPYYNYTYPEIITQRIPFIFGENLVLQGYDVPLKIEAGSILPVALLWKKTGYIGFNYNVGVLLVDETGAVRAQHDGAPQATFGDTSRWRIGEPQLDAHGIPIPPDLPPGEYQLLVVMYDWRNASRLPVKYPGRITDTAEIASIQVVPQGEYSPPQLHEITETAEPLEQPYQFGEHFTLIGAEFPQQAQVGSTFPVTTTWQVQHGGNFNATLSLKKGGVVTAINHLAISLYNEKFHDGLQTYRHEIYIPEHFPHGKYTLRVTIYDWLRVSTLPFTPDNGSYEAVLGTVEIGSP